MARHRARCRSEKQRLIRASPFGDHVKGRQITTEGLIIDDANAVADPDRASAALSAWMAAEERGYYRINLPRQHATAVADPGLGVYWLKTSDGTEQLPEPATEKPAWRA